MIQYTNGRFVCGNRIALKLPDDIWLDFDPPVIPNEGMIFYSEDLKVTIDVNLLETAQDACTFLESTREDYETFQVVRDLQRVSVASLEGYGLTYATEHEIYEEYALSVPGDVPALLDVCLTQRLDDPADREIYVRVRDELLAGLEPI